MRAIDQECDLRAAKLLLNEGAHAKARGGEVKTIHKEMVNAQDVRRRARASAAPLAARPHPAPR